ncbi:MAG: cobalamin-dependent protein [Thermoleophilia bacterium]
MHPVGAALRDLEENKVYELVEQEIEDGTSPLELVGHLNAGMIAVGERFSSGEYFISQLIYSAQILKKVMERLEPRLEGLAGDDSAGRVVIGTVKGDIHDIGKNLVVTLLRGAGFEVVDLGVDVPAERFVEAVRESGARALGLSALLNFTYPEMKNVVEAVEAAGLRDSVKIILGGAPIDEYVREFAGADYFAEDAVAGVNICREIYA